MNRPSAVILILSLTLIFISGCAGKLDYDNPRPKHLKRLLAEFTDLENEDRDLAAKALPKLGSYAVPSLLKLLSGNDAQIKMDTALVLGEIGPESRDAIPILVEFLSDEEELGKAAAQALGMIGPDSTAALFEVFDGYDDVARVNAARAFAWMGAAGKDIAPELIKLFWDTKLRSELAYSLSRMGTEILPLLLLAMVDTDTELRRGAAEAIGHIGPAAVSATPELIIALNGKDGTVRIEAAEALGKVASSPDAAVELTKFLVEEHAWMFHVVKKSLVQLGEISIPPLIKALEVKNNVYRTNAALTLAEVEGDKTGAIPILKGMCSNADANVRKCAAIAIESIGPDAIDTAGLIKKLIRDRDADVRFHAIRALDAIQAYDDEAVRILIDAFDDGDPRVSSMAATALSHFGTNALNPLLKALRSSDDRVYTRASRTLGEMGARANDAIPDLVEMMGDRVSRLRSNAVKTLGYMGIESTDAIQSMAELLADKEPAVRRVAAEALGMLGRPAVAALKQLIAALDDDDQRVRRSAAEALGNIGPDASPALPKLRELLESTRKGKHTYDVIFEAISKISGTWEGEEDGKEGG